MQISHKVAAYLRSAREAKGFSQEYVAESIGISQSSYAHLEAGKTSLTLDRLTEIMMVLELKWSEIIHQLNESTPHENANHLFSQDAGFTALIEELQSEVRFLRNLVHERSQK